MVVVDSAAAAVVETVEMFVDQLITEKEGIRSNRKKLRLVVTVAYVKARAEIVKTEVVVLNDESFRISRADLDWLDSYMSNWSAHLVIITALNDVICARAVPISLFADYTQN